MMDRNKFEVDKRLEIKETVDKYAYYIMIILIALLAVFVPPLCLGAISGDFSLAFPTTLSAWIVWGIVNGSSIIANISILVLFKLQAKKNCLEHPNYIKATEMLDELSRIKQLYIPRSPAQMDIEEYVKKVVFIILFTLGSFIAISNLIISFDILTLISTLISMLTTLIVSWTSMLNNEEYWTKEYLNYAVYVNTKMQEESLKTAEKEESMKEKEDA